MEIRKKGREIRGKKVSDEETARSTNIELIGSLIRLRKPIDDIYFDY